MIEMFDLLSKKERRILQVLVVLLVAVVLFFLFVALKEKNEYKNSVNYLSSKQKEYKILDANKIEKENEWQSWQNAHEDIEDLREKYLFRDNEGYASLRLMLQQIFDESRIQHSDIRYQYSPFDKEKIRKVNITFNLIGPYFSLKRFINSVENLQRFLLIEKIDFIDTPSQGGDLKLKITLAGYYAN